MSINAIALRFADRATAYQALSDLKHIRSAATDVRAAVLIERLANGSVRIPEGMDNEEGKNTAIGGLVGSVVGILGGPLGVLLGWSIGALIGGGSDGKRAALASSAVIAATPHVPADGTMILAEVVETDTQVLDQLAMSYEAILERRPADALRDELKAMEEAADNARKEEAKRRRASKHPGKQAKEAATAPTREATA
ncbi:hypothetical protein ABT300_14960 [Streptomyces sp. NPDC001027]|uniref:hypothetical protein n=1 Tax=Streptomyces sp. NPDC001027 TaxID=3154771 RepID=UPI00331AF58F